MELSQKVTFINSYIEMQFHTQVQCDVITFIGDSCSHPPPKKFLVVFAELEQNNLVPTQKVLVASVYHTSPVWL